MKNFLVSLAVAAAILLFLAANFAASEARAIRPYPAPVDHIYAAALKAIELQGHVIRDKSVETDPAKRGARSSYIVEMRLRLRPLGAYARMGVFGDQEHGTVVVFPHGFPNNFLYAFAGGPDEVRGIFTRLDVELCATDKVRCPPPPAP